MPGTPTPRPRPSTSSTRRRKSQVFHYRGYAPSTGVPGAKALNRDALLIHDEFARRQPGRRIVAVGFSIGSGVAAYLAAHRPLAGAILVTPFDDLARVAADHYPWLPVRLLFRHRMDSAAHLERSRVPVAIVAGGRDTLILPRRTDALRAVGRQPRLRSHAGRGQPQRHLRPPRLRPRHARGARGGDGRGPLVESSRPPCGA
jgi:alpha-beta hydrolase superfamily lysophospholipase